MTSSAHWWVVRQIPVLQIPAVWEIWWIRHSERHDGRRSAGYPYRYNLYCMADLHTSCKYLGCRSGEAGRKRRQQWKHTTMVLISGLHLVWISTEIRFADVTLSTIPKILWLPEKWLQRSQKAASRKGVSITLKHFTTNNKETNRNSSDSRVSERALREIYLKGFEIAVKEAQPWSIMTSYNFLNGIETSENKELLTNITRGEWGYEGIFMHRLGQQLQSCKRSPGRKRCQNAKRFCCNFKSST